MKGRDPSGRFVATTPALVRFAAKCRFDPCTGCVVWIGGQTQGRGHNVPYGSFWFEGRRWFAHRWAAKFIHGLEIDELQVDHCCPAQALPNTLCVEHVQVLTAERNRHLQTHRRRMFIHLQVGLLSYEDVYGPDEGVACDVPFYDEPAWLRSVSSPSRPPTRSSPLRQAILEPGF